MRTLILASLFTVLPLTGGGVRVSNLTQYWTESGINRQMLASELTTEKCASSPAYLAACREAIAVAKRQVDFGKIDLSGDDFNAVLEKVDQFKFEGARQPKEVVWAAMYNAFLQTFDSHAGILPTPAYDAMMSEENEVRYGTGMRVILTNAGVFVRSVTRFSPAARKGLRVHDRIVSVNGTPLGGGERAHEKMELLAGKVGDQLNLVIERKRRKIKYVLKIGVVSEPNVQTEILANGKNQYLLVRLLQFKQESCDKLREKIGLVKALYQGIILDLRDNTGGLVDQSVCIASLFVGRKDIVGQKKVPIRIPVDIGEHPEIDERIDWRAGIAPAVYDKVPLVVLINSVSSSASEIVAGALQDYKAAWIVGERSFGKGTVQNVEGLNDIDDFKIIYTTALFYRPSGITNQLTGVTPNFDVPMRRQSLAEERKYPREAEIFKNSIKPPAGEQNSWRETRMEVDQHRRCVENSNSDLRASEVYMKNRGHEDYQAAYAMALLSCLAKPPRQLSKHNR